MSRSRATESSAPVAEYASAQSGELSRTVSRERRKSFRILEKSSSHSLMASQTICLSLNSASPLRAMSPRFFLGSYILQSSRLMPALESDSPYAADATSGIRCASSITSISFANKMPDSSPFVPIPAESSEKSRLWFRITTSAEEISRRAFW